MIDNIVVGKTITNLRQDRGLTQQQLAATLSVSHQAVSKWENGAALPDIQTMMTLTEIFGITVEQLVKGEIPEERIESRAKTPDRSLRDFGDSISGISHSYGEENDILETEKDEADNSAETPITMPETESDNSDSKDKKKMSESKAETFDVQKLLKMAPYMTKQAVDELLLENQSSLSPGDIARFAPYVSRECLEKLIENSESMINWETLQRIAPFLKREMVDGLTRATAKGERFVRRALDQSCRATEEIGKSIEDVSQKIGIRMEKAFRKAVKFGEEAAKGVSSVVNDMVEENRTRSSRSEILRNAAFERALRDERWDWIATHIDELSDKNIKNEIIDKANALNMQEWLKKNIDGYLETCAIDDAIEGKNWDWLGEHIMEMEESVQTRIFLAAVEDNQWQWICDNALPVAEKNCIGQIAKSAYEAGEYACLTEIMESRLDENERETLMNEILTGDDWKLLAKTASMFDRSYIGKICVEWGKSGQWERIYEIISHTDSISVEKLMELAIAEGNFEVIDVLDEYLD